MRLILAAAAFLPLVFAAAASADTSFGPTTVTLSCSSGNSCSANVKNDAMTAIKHIACDWNVTTVTKIEVLASGTDGSTIVDKEVFVLNADQRAARSMSGQFDRGFNSGTSQALTADVAGGAKFSVKMTSSASGTLKGTCYVTG